MSYRQYLLKSTGRFAVTTSPFILVASVAATLLDLNATSEEIGLAVALPFMTFIFLGEVLSRVLPEPEESNKDRGEPTRASVALGMAIMTVLVVPFAYLLFGIVGLNHLLPVLWLTTGLACLPAALVLLGRFVEFGISVTVKRTLAVRPARVLVTPAIVLQRVRYKCAAPFGPFDDLPPPSRRPDRQTSVHAT